MRKLALASIAVAALLAGGLLANAAVDKTAETYRQINLFGEVFERVRSDYVEEVSDSKLIEAAINGMLSSLDPHSSYLDADHFKDMQVQTKGEFGGLGIEVTMDSGFVKVVSPIDDTPAFHAGIKPGDFIVALDGESVQGLTLADAVEKMRGPVNTSIKLTIRRDDQPPFDVTLTRDVIHIQSVRGRLEGNVGYVRITTFNEQTQHGLEKAIVDIRAQAGDKLAGIILDLRNNPGGLLDQAVSVSDSFIDKGEIVSTRGRKPDDVQRYNAKPGDLAAKLPMVVIINGGSASASEIVAGALQDHHRAIVLGTRSFGKGSVQTIIPLPGHGAMRLTTARYYTPSGRSIQAKGIEPDIVVPEAKIEVVEQASDRRSEADLRGALRNDKDPNAGKAKPAEAKSGKSGAKGAKTEGAKSDADDTGQDYQLARAVDLLRGIALYGSRSGS